MYCCRTACYYNCNYCWLSDTLHSNESNQTFVLSVAPIPNQVITPKKDIFSMGDIVGIGNFQMRFNNAHWETIDPNFPPNLGTIFLIC